MRFELNIQETHPNWAAQGLIDVNPTLPLSYTVFLGNETNWMIGLERHTRYWNGGSGIDWLCVTYWVLCDGEIYKVYDNEWDEIIIAH